MSGINLVAMMDIFTLLVFFLLVNSSGSEVLPVHRSVRLHESNVEVKPHEAAVITVSETEIRVRGEVVDRVTQLLRNPVENSPGLQAALEAQNRLSAAESLAASMNGREAIIMGEKTIPYAVLKKIMTTCTRAGYGRISLAVMRRQPGEG